MKQTTILIMSAAAAAILLCSCQSIDVDNNIPPPQGNIVKPEAPTGKYPPAGALNYMSTSLTAAAMRHFNPGDTVLFSYDTQSCRPEFNSYPAKTLHGVRDLLTFRPAPIAPFKVCSRITAGKENDQYLWEMKLEGTEKTLWSGRVIIEYHAQVPTPEKTEPVKKEKTVIPVKLMTFEEPVASPAPAEPTVIPPTAKVQEPSIITPKKNNFIPSVPEF